MTSNPDWARAGVSPPNKLGPLGDPTRWGANVVQNTPNIDGVTVFGGSMQTQQILSAQCRDGYARAWTLAGTLNAPTEFHELPNYSPGIVGSYWAVAIYVTMGVGQVQIVHSYDARAIIEADQDFYWNSDFANPFFEDITGFSSKPFIIPGALVGAAVNVQILQIINIAVGAVGVVPITTSLILNPFDPGAR